MNSDDFKKFKNANPNWGRLIAKDSNATSIAIRKFLKDATPFLEEPVRITQRAWHVLNDCYHIPICYFCKKEHVRYDMNDMEYRKYCSIKCSTSCPEYKAKLQATNIERYGVPYSAMNNDVYEKTITTNLKKYGVKYTSQAESTKLKQKETNLERYGVVSTTQYPPIKQKQIKTNVERYGYEYANDTILSDEVRRKLEDAQWLANKHLDNKLSCIEIAAQLGCDNTTVCKYFKKHGIVVKNYFSSVFEKEVKQFLVSHGMYIIENDRTTVSKQELDIYIPDKMIAIECNGLYWHSEWFKEPLYHLNKLKDCNKNGIRLIQILENEWNEKKDIVKSKLLSILGLDTTDTVYARKCTIVDVDNKEKKSFFDANHIQGNGPSSINLGLMYDGKLVACMGFIVNKDSYTLNRYATSCRVAGGFTKLLKHFEKSFNYPTIITFADLRWSEGNLYESTGFTNEATIPPDYYWCKGNKLWHKFNWRHNRMKQNLPRYDNALSETGNMHAHHFFKLYDSGKIRYKKKAA